MLISRLDNRLPWNGQHRSDDSGYARAVLTVSGPADTMSFGESSRGGHSMSSPLGFEDFALRLLGALVSLPRGVLQLRLQVAEGPPRDWWCRKEGRKSGHELMRRSTSGMVISPLTHADRPASQNGMYQGQGVEITCELLRLGDGAKSSPRAGKTW